MKKGLGIFNKIVFFINSVFASLLLLAYLLPLIPPSYFPILSVLSLAVPILLVINIAFIIYWLIIFKRQFLLSLIVLVLGFNHLLSLYKIPSEKNKNASADLKLMSYNVRQFNRFNWIAEDSVTPQLIKFIEDEQPDLVCMQEYQLRGDIKFSYFKEKYEVINKKENNFGQAIFSNYPIVNKGNINFKDSNNNAMFVDVAIKNDTVRIMNVHLQSLRLTPSVRELQKESKEKLIGRVGGYFEMQEKQAEQILENLNNCPYKSIICGDFNNSAFSYVYRKLSANRVDAFKKAGDGFGKTFDFDFIPLRIDFILADEQLEIKNFENLTDVTYSDHYPIMTTISLEK